MCLGFQIDGTLMDTRMLIITKLMMNIPSGFFLRLILLQLNSKHLKSRTEKIKITDFAVPILKDIVFILENRSSVWEELYKAPTDLKEYLQDEFRQLLKKPLFEEWVDVHAGFGSPPATYYIINKLKQFSA